MGPSVGGEDIKIADDLSVFDGIPVAFLELVVHQCFRVGQFYRCFFAAGDGQFRIAHCQMGLVHKNGNGFIRWNSQRLAVFDKFIRDLNILTSSNASERMRR